MVLDGWCHRAPARPNNSIVEFICTTRLAAASALFARGSLSDKKKGSVLLVACKNIWFAAVPAHAASAPALAGQQIDEVTLSHTRQATPSRSSGAPRTDGLCIFKTPKKARFAAAHVASTVTASTSSRLRELVSLQHACHMLRYHSHTTHMTPVCLLMFEHVSESLLMISELSRVPPDKL